MNRYVILLPLLTMYKLIFRQLLFFLSPERAHYTAMWGLRTILKFPGAKFLFDSGKNSGEEVELFGLKFKNRLGVAAGFDKEGVNIDALAAIGFGFVEIGTVTPKEQDGNPQPRLFRLKKDEAIINRMGFNSKGMDVAYENLKKRKSNIIVGGNIGKNKLTPNENAMEDYLLCFHKLYDQVDYIAINVSSPNTPNLRALQEKEPLTKLIQGLQNANQSKAKKKPILLKIAPDLSNEQLDDIIDIMAITKLDGLIATNTTIDRSSLLTNAEKVEEIGAGGLSGKPVKQRSTEVIKYLSEKSNKGFPIIGVGGISSAEDAQQKIEAGAALVQVYTGFIYEGPSLVSKIRKKISG
ncbi:MAG: dihydroorotate dehydrogenase [Patiriisocius sp.]|jgi:dihydroorotate dehydrogenase